MASWWLVRFAPFSELVTWITELSEERLAPVAFANDNLPKGNGDDDEDSTVAAEPSLIYYSETQALAVSLGSESSAAVGSQLTSGTGTARLSDPIPIYCLNDGTQRFSVQTVNLSERYVPNIQPGGIFTSGGTSLPTIAGINPIANYALVNGTTQFLASNECAWLTQGSLGLGSTADPMTFNQGAWSYEGDLQTSGPIRAASFAGRGYAAGWYTVPKRNIGSEGNLQVYGVSSAWAWDQSGLTAGADWFGFSERR